MEIVTGEMPMLVEVGLTRDLVAGAPVGGLGANSAARDYLARYSSVSPDNIVHNRVGDVHSIVLDRLKTPSGETGNLHIIGTHEGNNWRGAPKAVAAGFEQIGDIIGGRLVDDTAREILATLGKSIDGDNPTSEDIQLIRAFASAAQGQLIASFFIGAGSTAQGQKNVPLRAILAAMINSSVGDNIKVVLRPDVAPAARVAQLMVPRTPLITAKAKTRVLDFLAAAA